MSISPAAVDARAGLRIAHHAYILDAVPMPVCDTLIRNARVIDGSGGEPQLADVAIAGDRICAVGAGLNYAANELVDGTGHVLAPGFIDVHTHDDTNVIRTPQMLPKLSQGVTTVIVGNCGISAAPVRLAGDPPDPMNLLGDASAFRYPTFAAYIAAIGSAQPAVNVAALVGHTALRNNHMDRLDCAATAAEIDAMRSQLTEALDCGALGLSTGLAYLSANAATTEEVLALGEPLARAGALYTTHLRSETAAILDAMREAFTIGRECRVPVVISHLKCAGVDNWGRSGEVLHALDTARASQPVSCDCYPYAAGSSTLDLRQVDERVEIMITWSRPHPELAGQTLAQIAQSWQIDLVEAARRLQPAGAIYHSISEDDMRRILRHPATMIGSDGLPNDPRPHPRLWGTFPRVLGKYSRDEKLFSLTEAVHKMTGMPAARFGFADRGLIREGSFADLVLFDPETVRDTATYDDPARPAEGIARVWVNGMLSCLDGAATGLRSGRFLKRSNAVTNETSSQN
jgi:N-acyl-D-aspartate/D-glutamate deacylase